MGRGHKIFFDSLIRISQISANSMKILLKGRIASFFNEAFWQNSKSQFYYKNKQNVGKHLWKHLIFWNLFYCFKIDSQDYGIFGSKVCHKLIWNVWESLSKIQGLLVEQVLFQIRPNTGGITSLPPQPHQVPSALDLGACKPSHNINVIWWLQKTRPPFST